HKIFLDEAAKCDPPLDDDELTKIWRSARKFEKVVTSAADYVPPEPKVESAGDLTIEKDDDMWLVEGPWLQRLVATVNFSDYESRMFFDRILRESGVFARMEEMGVKDGDTVCMYDLMFEYKE
ncbi:MAG: Obg family GTPase CgtA, partial [Erysipelotrichaceae bacterium]|nr:Obg family GTPase CgtA [Erysipelotrichaceae bacterium]